MVSANQTELKEEYSNRLDKTLDLLLEDPSQILSSLPLTDDEAKFYGKIMETNEKSSQPSYVYYENIFLGENSSVNINHSRNQNIKAKIIKTQGTGSFSLGDFSAETRNSFNKYSDSDEQISESEIKSLLSQLQEAIKASENLDNDCKDGALESARDIEKGIISPENREVQKKAKLGYLILRGIVVGAPVTAAVLNIWEKLEPMLKKLLEGVC